MEPVPLPLARNCSGTWKRIVNTNGILQKNNLNIIDLIARKCGDGSQTSFWFESWVRGSPLATRLPALARLDANINATVKERFTSVNGSLLVAWNWSSAPSSPEETDELQLCSCLLSNMSLDNNQNDKWVLNGDASGKFSVKSVRKLLINSQQISPINQEHQWNSWLPLKVNIFAWRTIQNRIPTRVNLSRRNMPIDSVLCPFCNELPEDIDHMFSGCRIAIESWNLISKWCNMQPFFAFNYRDIICMHNTMPLSNINKRIFHAIITTTCWAIWKARNACIFDKIKPVPACIVTVVKSSSLLWLKGRSKLQNLDPTAWLTCPFVPT